MVWVRRTVWGKELFGTCQRCCGRLTNSDGCLQTIRRLMHPSLPTNVYIHSSVHQTNFFQLLKGTTFIETGTETFLRLHSFHRRDLNADMGNASWGNRTVAKQVNRHLLGWGMRDCSRKITSCARRTGNKHIIGTFLGTWDL